MASRTERSRLLILDAADEAFREQGLPTTPMEEIARRAGLTRKTVYNLFASKEDIARRLIARIEALPEPLYRARIEANEPALAILEKVLLDSAGWCAANPSLARLALEPAERPSLVPPSGRASLQHYVRDALVLGQRQGSIRSDEDGNFMTLIVLGIFGQAMLSALAGAPVGQDDIRRIVRIVVEGIGARSAL
jgi:TetR/AcrR family transcriptional regulator of autoinduction and epiphytic fitness